MSSTSEQAATDTHLIAGAGEPFWSTDPATGQTVWTGQAATAQQLEVAIRAARSAQQAWFARPHVQRVALLARYSAQLSQNKQKLARIISEETGKPDWEASAEVDAMIGKIPISIEAFHQRRNPTQTESAGVTSATRYKPMGVLAVFGPYNMPGHLPNGHIVPALLAGNAVIFKPSELTPMVGQTMAELFAAAGFPPGVITIAQGGKETGAALARHRDIDGVLFTGSVAGGLAISKLLLDQPGKILALEMGGNNPLVVWDATNLPAAAYLIVQSAFITAGQRCSCARRLIVPQGAAGGALLDKLIATIIALIIGPHDSEPQPFMGPVISDSAADRLLAAQRDLANRGGKMLVEMKPIEGQRRAMLSPGLIDVTNVPNRPDVEWFGPLLQVIRVADFDAALAEANHTAFGLAAGLLSDDAALWDRFYRTVRAGVVYWNRQTTGGSSALPFGGTGLSGNHRPSGSWAADYCSYPIAVMETPTLELPAKKTPGIEIIAEGSPQMDTDEMH
jgi:succinylglutamic semialdehyde dehydrogenase